MFRRRLKAAIRGCLLAHGELTADQLQTALGIWLPIRFYLCVAKMMYDKEILFMDREVTKDRIL